MRIITFHGIGKPERALEPGEDPFWLREERFHQILDAIAEQSRKTTFAITFDDGNLSDYRIALPALLDRGLDATFFVLTGRIGKAGSLTPSQIRALSNAGMTIGSHGIEHVDWTGLQAADLAQELQQSKAVLEGLIGRQIDSVAIPFGRYNAAVLRAIRHTDYSYAYSSDGGEAEDGDFPLPRTSATSAMSDEAIADILEGRIPMWKIARSEVARFVKRLV